MEDEDEEANRPVPEVNWTLKSENSLVRSMVTFKNLGNEPVFLFWIDYQGFTVFYAKLPPMKRGEPGHCMDTFATHPWIVVDKDNRRWLLNGEMCWLPPHPDTWFDIEQGWINPRWVYGDKRTTNCNTADCFEEYSGDNDARKEDSYESNADGYDGENSDGDNSDEDSDNIVELINAIDLNLENEEEEILHHDGDNGQDYGGDNAQQSDEYETDSETDVESNDGLYDVVRAENSYHKFEVLILPPGCMTLRQLTLLRCCQLYGNNAEIMDDLDIPSGLKMQLRETWEKYFHVCRR